MTIVLGEQAIGPVAVGALPISDEPVRQQVWGILAGLHSQAKHSERRADQRFAYPHLLYLTPLSPDGVTPGGESLVVVGKQLSERGLSFFYQQPLTDRRMIASLEVQPGRWVGFVIDITWCRFTRHRWYESGGRFLYPVASPVPDQ